MITTADFKKQIVRPFREEMCLHGFKGSGFEYFQETEELLIAVYIEPSRWGGSCSAGFAVHPKQIDKNTQGKIDAKNLKLHLYEFRMSLSNQPIGVSWEYSDNKGANLKTLFKIIEAIKKVAFPVINMFKAQPNILELFEVNEMDSFHENWIKRTGVSVATTDTRFAWAQSLYLEKRNLSKAKGFAKWLSLQLQDHDSEWFGKEDLNRILMSTNRA